MKNILLFLLAIAFFLPQGCKDKKDTSTKIDGYSEIMAIHDSVMPKMAEVQQLKRKLQKLAPNYTDSLTLTSINYSIGELVESDDLMQDWMHNWAEKSKGMDKESDAYQQFLKTEKKAIINVSDRIYHAMEHANKTLASYQLK